MTKSGGLRLLLIKIGFWIDEHIIRHHSPYFCAYLEYHHARLNGVTGEELEMHKMMGDEVKWHWR